MKNKVIYYIFFGILLLNLSCKYLSPMGEDSAIYGAAFKGNVVDKKFSEIDGVEVIVNKKGRYYTPDCFYMKQLTDTFYTDKSGNFDTQITSWVFLNCPYHKIADSLGQIFKDTINIEFYKSGYRLVKKDTVVLFNFAISTLGRGKKLNIKWEENNFGTIILEPNSN